MNKEGNESQETQAVKQAAINNSVGENTLTQVPQANQMPQQNNQMNMNNNVNQNEFSNPFSQDLGNNNQNIQENLNMNSDFTSPSQAQGQQMSMGQNQNLGMQSQNQGWDLNSNFQNQQEMSGFAMENNGLDEEKIQEIVYETFEKLLENKWNDITNNVESVINWKEIQEKEINRLKEDLSSIKEGVDKIEKKIMSKIESYDTNILDVNSEIKALEKVFQKITPTLINNVNELSKIAEDLKGIKEEKSKKKEISFEDSIKEDSEDQDYSGIKIEE
ncbi:MAG: hypothetical protein KC589_01500 [Nanoarchaeota archaeon]|nr:hypothetical protein [Nanoarchaeota archaeon]